MKKIVLVVAALATYSLSMAQELPLPSPYAEVEQKIGLTEVEIEYHRPGVKDREVWGNLVPFEKVWRTGANKNTTIELSTDATIAGEKVKAGKYSLFLTPYQDDRADLAVNAITEGWGTGDYKDSANIATPSVKMQESEVFVETMLFYFDNITPGSADLVLAWADKKVIIPIEVDYVSASVENIEKAIEEDGENFRVYNNAASFYIANNLEAAIAVKYSTKSVELEKRFWNLKTHSEALAANKQFKEAVEMAEESLKMSIEAEYEPYIKMNEANIEAWSKMK